MGGEGHLVSRGTDKCWGEYNPTTGKGWGPGYENACIHSGTIAISGDLPTNWYNYSLASAGTIIDENTTSENPAANMVKATESICPKGWTMPTRAQRDSNRNVISFNPVLGGIYSGGILYQESIRGLWWSSEAADSALRSYLNYEGTSLTGSSGGRYYGFYIRCVPAP